MIDATKLKERVAELKELLNPETHTPWEDVFAKQI
jgi:hypothetical protein